MAEIIINSNVPLVRYTATAGQTLFTYNFPIFADADLKVVVDGVTLTLTTGYTVTGAATNAGGTITLVAGAAVGNSVLIYSDIAIERTTDFQDNGDLLAETVNRELDRLVRMLQQVSAIGGDNTTGFRFDPDAGGLPLDALTGSVGPIEQARQCHSTPLGQLETTFDLVENTTNKTAAETAETRTQRQRRLMLRHQRLLQVLVQLLLQRAL